MIYTALVPYFLAGVVLAQDSITVTSTGNPLLADGSFYSADPAPFVVNNTLYVLSGHDEAGPRVNSFIMNDWLLWSTKTPNPAGSEWTLQPDIATPESLFSWARAGGAYASQIIPGRDGKFYMYASVQQAQTTDQDAFSIGVAVSDSPTGPFKDAHPAGPIISQSVLGNTIHNIDPTVFIDDDGRPYLYWGSFNQLYGLELTPDMTSVKGTPVKVTSLTGFFEAAWLMKREESWYMLYAGNNAGPNSPCTPTSYHACIAYGTASSPLGPWTYRGTILDIVSSTTSHSGAFQMNGKWYLTYHTADAAGATHFRRSIAFDEMTFDDTQSPPRINKVIPTRRPGPAPAPTRNIAPRANATSVGRTPIQYWIKAVNNAKVPANPLPPDYWSSWVGDANPATNTLIYEWDEDVELNGTRMVFFADAAAGANKGVAPPKDWRVEYLDAAGAWVAVKAEGAYPTVVTDNPAEVGFETVRTRSIRAVLNGSGTGPYAAVGVKEWEALAPTAQ